MQHDTENENLPSPPPLRGLPLSRGRERGAGGHTRQLKGLGLNFGHVRPPPNLPLQGGGAYFPPCRGIEGGLVATEKVLDCLS